MSFCRGVLYSPVEARLNCAARNFHSRGREQLAAIQDAVCSGRAPVSQVCPVLAPIDPNVCNVQNSRFLLALLFRLLDCLAEFLDRGDLRSAQCILRYVPPDWRRIQRILATAQIHFKSIVR